MANRVRTLAEAAVIMVSPVLLAIALKKDAMTNRVRALAEAAVIMVSPVLLAIALKKVDLTRKEHGRVAPSIMLGFAAFTLIAAICPFLICCISKSFSSVTEWLDARSWLPPSVTEWLDARPRLPLSMTEGLATLPFGGLIVLACWIIHLILSDKRVYPAFGAVFGLGIVVRTVSYFRAQNAQEFDRATVSKLENSLEFLSGITALLFLGLEGLALEGQINSSQDIQSRLAVPMVSSFIACLFGVCFMLLETIPPLKQSNNNAGCCDWIKSSLTEIVDVIMAFAVGVVMLTIMFTHMKLWPLLLLAPPFLFVVVLAFLAVVNRGGGGEDPEPASLELTKVTFTGFLAVSVPTLSSDGLNKSTEYFLVIAALAVVLGLVWRLVTHIKSAAIAHVATVAKVASFFAHLCVAIATVPFTVMAGKALLDHPRPV